MSIFTDWHEEMEGYRLRYKFVNTLKPRTWLSLHKWRKQRANRGWSDRDTWGAGDHIAKITAEILQHLHDHAYTDWRWWFENNVKEEGKGAYTTLPQVIKDITDYLNFAETSWADGLDTKRDSIDEVFEKRSDGFNEYKGPDWYEGKKKLTDAAVKHRINKWAKEHDKKYKKAQNAMQFFGHNFAGFWD